MTDDPGVFLNFKWASLQGKYSSYISLEVISLYLGREALIVEEQNGFC